MKYGGTARDEMEVTIRLDREERQEHICSTCPSGLGSWSGSAGARSGSPDVTAR